MLPYLVVHLISLMVVMTLVFIGGFFVTVNSWDWHLIIPLIIMAVFVCKYYFEKCVINILFIF